MSRFGALRATIAGSAAVVAGRLSRPAIRADIRHVYSEPAELAHALRRTADGLTAGEHSLILPHVRPGDLVADIGCGTGRVALALRRLGVAVVGVDLNEDMVREAARLTPPAGPRTAFLVMDAGSLALRPASFDAALMIGSVIAYLPGRDRRRAALGDVRGLLRPGGRLVLVTPSRAASLRFRAWFAALRVVHGALRLAGRAAAEWEPGDRFGPAWSGDPSRLVYWHMYEPAELRADLAAAGLDIVQASVDAYMMAVVAVRA